MAEKYERGRALGEGTYALVYEAFRKTDRLPVAIKRIKGRQPTCSGVDFTGLREVNQFFFVNTYILRDIAISFFNRIIL